ncbi:tyrosine-protein phosphatase [Antribacter sp. KLBMP9083]|uniref:Tyrosine-protein phosphatase n=1 Tax=Antribacter soli TaxID=2910976 RepID=A0AA41QFU8_9MICO|nr:tyrosine-protein phosphatase [Antribacter soli]MCF4121881.1 tyrosine-protein phosphatase [Antribacter soli]
MTSTTPLHLHWPDCLNARDLGGLPLADGGTVRERALVRADSLTFLTPEGVAAVRGYGVARIIDLRRPFETVRYPHAFADDPIYHPSPVQEPEDWEEGPWADLYCGMLARRPTLFARAVGAIADAPAGAVVVHCAAGKDRTGLVVAMALTLAGVPEEAVVADYVLTNERLAPRYTAERAAAALPDDAPAAPAGPVSAGEGPGAATGTSSDIDPATGEPVRPPRHPARSVPPGEEVMAETLAYLRDRYGSVHGYLTAGGLTQQQHDALVTRLTV